MASEYTSNITQLQPTFDSWSKMHVNNKNIKITSNAYYMIDDK